MKNKKNPQFFTLPVVAQPDPARKMKFAPITLRMTNNIFTSSARAALASPAKDAGGKLWTFEELQQASGFVLYEADLPSKFTRDPANLVVSQLRDRAQIFIDGKHIGVLSRENNIDSIPISASHGKRLQIFVENQGRINFQENFDLKGILGNVSLQSFDEPYYQIINGWTITGYPFDNYTKISEFIETDGFRDVVALKNGWLRDGPALLYGELNVPSDSEISDTWWHTAGFGKGVLFVNGFNLGRYWPLAGPQMTMYIPSALLNEGVNTFVLLEQQKVPNELVINFTDEPDFSED